MKTRTDTPAAKHPGRYAIMLPPPMVNRVEPIQIPTPLPGKRERITVRPPR